MPATPILHIHEAKATGTYFNWECFHGPHHLLVSIHWSFINKKNISHYVCYVVFFIGRCEICLYSIHFIYFYYLSGHCRHLSLRPLIAKLKRKFICESNLFHRFTVLLMWLLERLKWRMWLILYFCWIVQPPGFHSSDQVRCQRILPPLPIRIDQS